MGDIVKTFYEFMLRVLRPQQSNNVTYDWDFGIHGIFYASERLQRNGKPTVLAL